MPDDDDDDVDDDCGDACIGDDERDDGRDIDRNVDDAVDSDDIPLFSFSSCNLSRRVDGECRLRMLVRGESLCRR